MRETGTMKRIIIIAAAALLASSTALRAEDQATQQYQKLLTPLLQGGEDILGTPVEYPDGPANVTAAEVTIPPGGETGWHEHEVPLFGHILEGELTVDYGTKGKKTYRAGDSFLEAVDWPHNGTNTGTVPMRLIAVYMGGGGEANTVASASP
jgi:quercetin dioxygenase-like cupin family protein